MLPRVMPAGFEPWMQSILDIHWLDRRGALLEPVLPERASIHRLNAVDDHPSVDFGAPVKHLSTVRTVIVIQGAIVRRPILPAKG
jgi:hypothetical protein